MLCHGLMHTSASHIHLNVVICTSLSLLSRFCHSYAVESVLLYVTTIRKMFSIWTKTVWHVKLNQLISLFRTLFFCFFFFVAATKGDLIQFRNIHHLSLCVSEAWNSILFKRKFLWFFFYVCLISSTAVKWNLFHLFHHWNLYSFYVVRFHLNEVYFKTTTQKKSFFYVIVKLEYIEWNGWDLYISLRKCFMQWNPSYKPLNLNHFKCIFVGFYFNISTEFPWKFYNFLMMSVVRQLICLQWKCCNVFIRLFVWKQKLYSKQKLNAKADFGFILIFKKQLLESFHSNGCIMTKKYTSLLGTSDTQFWFRLKLSRINEQQNLAIA